MVWLGGTGIALIGEFMPSSVTTEIGYYLSQLSLAILRSVVMATIS